jgi:hypothetical protein
MKGINTDRGGHRWRTTSMPPDRRTPYRPPDQKWSSLSDARDASGRRRLSPLDTATIGNRCRSCLERLLSQLTPRVVDGALGGLHHRCPRLKPPLADIARYHSSRCRTPLSTSGRLSALISWAVIIADARAS